MADEQSPQNEARQLADAMFDHRMTPDAMQRLDELITSDLSCLQAYVERIDFHGELLDQAKDKLPSDFTATAINQIARNSSWRERRVNWLIAGGTLASVLIIGSILTVLIRSGAFLPASVGTIANLSSDVQSKSPLELGQVVRKGGLLQLQSGITTLQLPHATLDLVGPAKLRVEGTGQVRLYSGTVNTAIDKGGEGFKVMTSDAEVVDLGTEFMVRHDPDEGTEVNVRRGRARASLMNWQGQAQKVLDLTANRAARLRFEENIAKEIDFSDLTFQSIDESRGGIRSMDGNLRTTAHRIRSFRSDRITTPNHLLIVPERQNIELTEDLRLNGLEGETFIPAGSIVSTYLVHFDPTDLGMMAPRGAITFFGKIAAVVGSSSELAATDSRFGLEDTFYESESFRELELDEDEVLISDDRKTISFYFGASPPQYLDEARVFVISNPR